jgi:hypothetical protein
MSVKFITRLIIVLVVGIVALAAQTALQAHLDAPGPIPPGMLTKKLDQLPLQLGDWIGKDLALDESVVYTHPMEYLQRGYINVQTKQQVQLWVVYSEVGEDRGHHPEVCYPVAGQPEDFRARADIEVPGHKSPVQQLRYGKGSDMKLVYYWHYTLPSPETPDLDDLQRTYQRLRQRSASVTLQVFAPEQWPDTAEGAIEIVRLVDDAFQSLLGPNAVRGCQRLPVTLN